MQLVILASGRGSRLNRKTKKIPKCLVKLKNKSIIDYNLKFYKKFKKKIIITGYKSHLLKKKFMNNNFKFVENKKFSSTNMVYSLFCASKIINQSLVVCYSDIIFDYKIYKKLTKNTTSIVVKNNWYNYWKKRMSNKKILDDAEDLVIRKGYVNSIGGKIGKKLPKCQFMGLVKIKYKDFRSLKIFFTKLKNKKIDFTNFLNLAIKNKIIKLKAYETNLFWVEIDNIKDLKVAEKIV
jgi:choline kinase|tara:strand:- start:171 stop:881 length:711 start_codon:yes stop_codon:yes gene_type:complete